jgi:lipid A 3-O-deacylase
MISFTGATFQTMAVAVALSVVARCPASADGLIHELKIGALYHDMPGLWSGFQREATSVDINVEAQLSPSMQVFFGTLRPAVGGNISTNGQTNNGYIDARWSYDAPSGVFVAIGLGASLHDGNTGKTNLERKALGSQLLFHIPLEAGYRFDAQNSVSVYFDHMSNGYTQRYNQGLDHLGIRYGYRF